MLCGRAALNVGRRLRRRRAGPHPVANLGQIVAHLAGVGPVAQPLVRPPEKLLPQVLASSALLWVDTNDVPTCAAPPPRPNAGERREVGVPLRAACADEMIDVDAARIAAAQHERTAC